jgi:demethylspheroidene O-methyltransferase
VGRWADAWSRTWTRIIASPRFQRWAAWFPLTRFIARRRARALFDLCAGFVYSQILHAGVRLGLYDALAAGPRSLDELASALGLAPDRAKRLLDASVALDLLERLGPGRYALGIHGAALLGNPGAVDMIHHHRMLYADLADPVALLRGETTSTHLSRYWAYANPDRAPQLSAADVSGYSELMASSQRLIAEDVLEAVSLRGRLLDVGGGDGEFALAAIRSQSSLQAVVFDLPAVAARAEERIRQAGLQERATAVGGDMLRDPLPEGADVVSLVRVLHDLDDDDAETVLRAVRQVLPPRGQLVLAEPMAGVRSAGPVGDAYFGFYLLAMGKGRPRTPEAIKAMLLRAGYSSPRNIRTRRPMLTQLLVARAAGRA